MPYTLTEAEKEQIRQEYIQNYNTINNYLPDGYKYKLDLNALNKKLNDPREAWLYKKRLEVKAREVKKKEIQDRLAQKLAYLKDPRKPYELERVMHTDLIPSDDPEAMAYNEEVIKQYYEHPEAMVQYRFQKVLNSKVDTIADFAKCKDLESLMVLYAEKNPTFVEDSCSMTAVFREKRIFDKLTPEMKEFYVPICGNYENIIDASDGYKKINNGYFTLPHSMSAEQDMLINGTSFMVDHPEMNEMIGQLGVMDSTQKSLNSGFTKYFKWLKDNNVNMSEPGALSGSVIYPGNTDNKPTSMANFVANKELNSINNAVKVDLPPNTVAGIKKIFADDLTKEKGFKMPEVPAKFREPSWKLSRDELVFRYAVKNDCPVYEIDNGGISKIAEAIKGNFKEQLFGTTSHEYRNLITAMKDYDNTNHVSYHNSAPVKIAANQYLIHKGVTSREQAERLPYPAKDRALLCFDLIDTFQKNEGPEVAKIVPGKLQQVEVSHPIKRVQAIEDSSLVDDDLTLVYTNKQIDGNSVKVNKEIDNDNKIENDNEINLEK